MRLSVCPVVAVGVGLAIAGCKKPPEAAPKVGWVQNEGWPGACFFPKDFAAMGPGDRKLARQESLEEMMKQWRGERGDGVSFDDIVVTNVETTLLGRPEAIEDVAARNAALCERFMTGGGTSDWESYLTALPGQLTAGECYGSVVENDAWFNYLDIGRDWQHNVQICQGDKVEVTGAEIDYYRISEKGPWINAAGDPDKSTSGKDIAEYPCNMEGCYAGMLIMRFVGESGATLIVPVGNRTVFTAPENGRLDLMINDTTFFDNVYKVESGMQHHMSVSYTPG